MRNRFLGSLLGLLVGGGLVLGQPAQGPTPTPPPETESKATPAEPAPSGPVPPSNVWDGLASHFDGTCGHPKGDVLFADVDYLFWVLRNANVPVSLASNAVPVALAPNLQPAPNALSVSGAQNAQTLIGRHDLAYHHRPSSGVRVSLAYWQEDPLPELDWDRPRTWALEANYLVLGERGIAMRDDTAPNLVRQFFALNNRSETGLVVAAPGIASGGVTTTANYGLWGGELNLWKNIYYEYPGRTIRLDFLAGFRYLDLGEDLSVTSLSRFSQAPGSVAVGQSQAVTTAQNTAVPVLVAGLGYNYQAFAGNQILINDLFSTRNQFYGGQIGVVAKLFLEVLDINLAGKIAFGGNTEQVLIDGFQLRTLANGTTVGSRGGLLALPSNMGRFHHDVFSVVPEFDATATYVVCRHMSLTAGYQFVYWSRVLRPGDQIDRVLDVTQVPNLPANGVTPTGIARPAVSFHQTDFWAQGLVVGLQFTW